MPPKIAAVTSDTFDVIVIGGGPGGSSVSSYLAKAGKKVLLLEKEVFPRFHIGESLLPYSMPVFDRLGIREELDRTAQPKHGAELITACASSTERVASKLGASQPKRRSRLRSVWAFGPQNLSSSIRQVKPACCSKRVMSLGWES